MRAASLIILGVLSATALTMAPAQAMTVRPPAADEAYSPNIVQVDRRCGPNAHWVRRHHNRAGHLVRGHCAPNHRR